MDDKTKPVELTRQEYRVVLMNRWDRAHKWWAIKCLVIVFLLAVGLPVAVSAVDLAAWAQGAVLIVGLGLPMFYLLRGLMGRDRGATAKAAAFFEDDNGQA